MGYAADSTHDLKENIMGSVPGDPTPEDVQGKAVESSETQNKSLGANVENKAEVDGSTVGPEGQAVAE